MAIFFILPPFCKPRYKIKHMNLPELWVMQIVAEQFLSDTLGNDLQLFLDMGFQTKTKKNFINFFLN